MTKDDRKEIKLETEMRTQEISEMIDEGGLGAEKYYDIKKPAPASKSKAENENEKEDKED